MTGPRYEGATVIHYPGARCMFGQLADQRWAIWSVYGGEPIATWPADIAGRDAAFAKFNEWEALAQPAPANSGSSGWAVGVPILVLAVLFAIYYVVHALTYRGCLITPSLLDWPNACL